MINYNTIAYLTLDNLLINVQSNFNWQAGGNIRTVWIIFHIIFLFLKYKYSLWAMVLCSDEIYHKLNVSFKIWLFFNKVLSVKNKI